MTTKKQKREAAEAKRAAFEAQCQADGLAAQASDRARREARSLAMKEEVQRINARHEQILNAGIANMINDFGTLMATVPLETTVVPFKDKPGGRVIGTAEVTGTETEINVKVTLNEDSPDDIFADSKLTPWAVNIHRPSL